MIYIWLIDICIYIDMQTHIYVTNNQQKKRLSTWEWGGQGRGLRKSTWEEQRERPNGGRKWCNTISVKSRMTLNAWSSRIHLPSPGVSGLPPRVSSPKVSLHDSDPACGRALTLAAVTLDGFLPLVPCWLWLHLRDVHNIWNCFTYLNCITAIPFPFGFLFRFTAQSHFLQPHAHHPHWTF